MKGTTKIALSRENVKSIIGDHVAGMVFGPIEILSFEVHRNGGIDVGFKQAAQLPLVDDGAAQQADPEP